MADFETLTAEMNKLKDQLKIVLRVAEYPELDDLSGLDDYKQIRTADQRQQLEEYKSILNRLDWVLSTLTYYDRPIKEVSQLHKNESGRYETSSGHYYTSGAGIEFLREDEVYNEDTDQMEQVEIWTTSRIEHNGQDYYVVGYPDVTLSGLTVRIRG